MGQKQTNYLIYTQIVKDIKNQELQKATGNRCMLHCYACLAPARSANIPAKYGFDAKFPVRCPHTCCDQPDQKRRDITYVHVNTGRMAAKCMQHYTIVSIKDFSTHTIPNVLPQ